MNLHNSSTRLTAHDPVMQKDAARFQWFFGNRDKGVFAPSYLRGLRQQWSLDQWRAAIDKAINDDDTAEDAELNQKLTASLATGSARLDGD